MSATSLLDWRRRVAAIYAEIRASAQPAIAHQAWQAARNDLLATHPESPVPAADRAAFTGVPVAPYDPALRFHAKVDTSVAPARIEVSTGTDGVVPFLSLIHI